MFMKVALLNLQCMRHIFPVERVGGRGLVSKGAGVCGRTDDEVGNRRKLGLAGF